MSSHANFHTGANVGGRWGVHMSYNQRACLSGYLGAFFVHFYFDLNVIKYGQKCALRVHIK